MTTFSLLEDAYIMRDPFVDGGSGGIIIGADCCVCNASVCVSPVGYPNFGSTEIGMLILLCKTILQRLCHQKFGPLPGRNSQGTLALP